ncbi:MULTISPECIES: MFS transporter [unclassified Streptomyces]|uniref:MFS transporter n=1 Tax=unclassified Streptomyces TaxID=2593676 RepID=UPI002889ED2A|nr:MULTISPECIES: MFS transporter [unclassified Streptomyces]WNI21421.1 MFS transporter [Streptomyces sp. ITFR-16]WNI28239.1 MFS transporter [Streptomyces sp. ITFR-6]
MESVRSRALVPCLAFVCLVTAVIGSLGAPLIPSIAAMSHVSVADAQWSLTITQLVAAVATPVMGRLGDGPHRRRVVVGTLALVVIGCVLAALPLGFATLLVGRALQGIGLGLTPLTIAVARDALPAARSAPVIAMLSITAVTGVGLGYPLTGLVAQWGGVRGAYWLGVVVSALGLAAAAWAVPAARHRARVPLDILGAVLLALGTAGLLVAISEGEAWGWGSWRVDGMIGASVLLLAVWVFWELRTPHPLVALRLVRDRSVMTASVAAVLAGVGMYMLLSTVTRLVQTPAATGYGLGQTVVVAGLALTPFSIGSFLANRLTPTLVRWTSPRAVLPMSCLILLASMAMFTSWRGNMAQIMAVMFVAGLGVGVIFAVIPGFLVRAVPSHETGSAMSFNQVLRYIGYAVGSAMSAAVLEGHTGAGAAYPSSNGYTAVGLLSCVVWLVTAAVALIVPLRRRGGRILSGNLPQGRIHPVTESAHRPAAPGPLSGQRDETVAE